MPRSDSPSIARKAALVLWGMFTLALLFTVILLARQLIEMGETPLKLGAAENAVQPAAPSTATEQPDGTKEVTLYFTDSSGDGLAPESRRIEIGDSALENCRRAVQALIAGSNTGLAPILGKDVQLRALYRLDDGQLILDFTKELVAGHRWSANTEALLVYGLANTLTQSELEGSDKKSVTKVRLLMDGSPVSAAYAGHLDLSLPYGPDRSWIGGAASGDTGANG